MDHDRAVVASRVPVPHCRLTALGRTAARHETELMARLVAVAAAAGLFDSARRSTA